MKELDENQIDFLQDMVKTEGYRIFEDLVQEQANLLRKQATQRNTLLEDARLAIWNSAEAQGLERSLEIVKRYFE